MVDVVQEPIDDEQAEMDIRPPADFCDFVLEHAVTMYLRFEPCPLNAKVARWWNGHSSSHFPVLESSDVYHCGLMCLNDLYQTQKVFLNLVSLMSKRLALKRENPFPVLLSHDIIPIHGANVSSRLRCFRPSIQLKEKDMSEMFQFLHLAFHFLASSSPLTNFK